MVDEYIRTQEDKVPYNRVQIPLWSMNTYLVALESVKVGVFRFLYGR